MPNELKPCPFCGGEASMIKVDYVRGNTYCYCTECKAKSPYCLTREEAINAWNRRSENA